MVTLEQFCGADLIQTIAASGSLGLAVGVESIDDENCLSEGKGRNVGKPFPEALRRANKLGIQAARSPPLVAGGTSNQPFISHPGQHSYLLVIGSLCGSL